jgi:acyl-CoA dehydrogenase
MDFSPSPKVVELQARVMDFVRGNVVDAEAAFKKEMNALRAAGNPWQPTQTMETLKEKAKAAGLWNMFLPDPSLASASATSSTRRCARSWAAIRSPPRR